MRMSMKAVVKHSQIEDVSFNITENHSYYFVSFNVTEYRGY